MEKVEKEITSFYIHFNQDSHSMPIEDYQKAVNTTKIIFDNLTQDIIKTNEVKLMVSAPKEGGIVINWDIVTCAIAGTAFIWQFIESESGKLIIKRIFNKTPIEIINEGFDKLDFIKAVIKAFFEMKQDELKRLIDELKEINEEAVKLDKSLKAAGDFYFMCNSNQDINGIGFSLEHEFPIERKDFFEHLTNDIIRDLGVHTEYKSLTIVKPVTKRTSKGKWTLSETGANQEQNYTMEDEKFKEKTLNGDFVKQNPEDDEILALTEYNVETKNGIRIVKDRKVIEIYEFNKKKFENRDLPEDFELNKAKRKNNDTGQLNLFDLLDKNEENDNA